MFVTLVRHGETVGNLKQRIDGQTDGELTIWGAKQAVLVAQRLASEHYDAIYTAFPIAKLHPNTSVRLSPLLREKAGGIYEGMPLGTNEAEARKAGQSVREFRAEGGESWLDVQERAAKFWQLILSVHVHGAAFNALLPTSPRECLHSHKISSTSMLYPRLPSCVSPVSEAMIKAAMIPEAQEEFIQTVSQTTAVDSGDESAKTLTPPDTLPRVAASPKSSPQLERFPSASSVGSSTSSLKKRSSQDLTLKALSIGKSPSNGMESAPKVLDRASRRPQHILVITHGGFIKEFCNFAQKRTEGNLCQNKARNTSVWTFQCVLSGPPKPFRLLTENDASHLVGMGKKGPNESDPSDMCLVEPVSPRSVS